MVMEGWARPPQPATLAPSISSQSCQIPCMAGVADGYSDLWKIGRRGDSVARQPLPRGGCPPKAHLHTSTSLPFPPWVCLHHPCMGWGLQQHEENKPLPAGSKLGRLSLFLSSISFKNSRIGYSQAFLPTLSPPCPFIAHGGSAPV